MAFAVLLLMVALAYSFPGILRLRPSGVHQWRQTDCLSITSNYYERGMHFFEPEIHCLISDDLTSGKTIGEFPATYYFVAMLWKIFGKHEWIYRLFTMLLFMSGVWCFFKLLFSIYKDFLWSAIFAGSLMTAPLLVYYGTGFLSDVHAFSFVLIGAWVFYRYVVTQKKYQLIISLLLFALAGLLKVTALLLFLTLGGLFLLEWMGLALIPVQRVFHHRWLSLGLFVIGTAAVASWYVYAEHFNSIHGGKYTFNAIWPLWEAQSARLSEIVKKFRAIIVYQIFPKPWFYILGLMLLLILIHARALPKLIIVGLAILTMGCAAYVILWFQAFDVHDYYLTNLYILPAAITASFLHLISMKWVEYSKSRSLRIVISFVFIWGILYTSSNINMRFYAKEENNYLMSGSQAEVDFYKYSKWAYDQETRQLEKIEPYLEKLGIGKDDLV
ncbi:MAG: hypothetical protein K1X54_04265, partial [Flavobacteriales bacterium]|nr:hypothetical protein [Flavobacteriales bacterium]